MSEHNLFEYSGNELETFALAKNWRKYWMDMVRGFLGSDVLEVGAGIGTITAGLRRPEMNWVALEPDDEMFRVLEKEFQNLDSGMAIFGKTLSEYSGLEKFDSVLYFDVLEHIEHDSKEVELACSKLNPNGYLIILVPAHQSLFSPFDTEIGHFRRYDRQSLDLLKPKNMNQVLSRYLDSGGYFLSWANSRFLAQSAPTTTQIRFWDTFVIPVSRLVDRLLGFRFGKSLLVVWQIPPGGVSQKAS